MANPEELQDLIEKTIYHIARDHGLDDLEATDISDPASRAILDKLAIPDSGVQQVAWREDLTDYFIGSIRIEGRAVDIATVSWRENRRQWEWTIDLFGEDQGASFDTGEKFEHDAKAKVQSRIDAWARSLGTVEPT